MRTAGKNSNSSATLGNGFKIMLDGPDFLCVGMHKGGTRWLFDQLQYHPDFWMPPLKELHYFDRDSGAGKNAYQALQFARGLSDRKKTQRNTGREWDERDFVFLEEMAAARGALPDMERYARMFAQRGNLLSGDITPHYCSLDEELVTGIMARFPYLRVLLLVRDPVKRAWSHIGDMDKPGRFDRRLLTSPAEFRSFLQDSKKIRQLSYPSRAHRIWSKHTPPEQYRFLFLDDVSTRAEETRGEILLFLGADPAKRSGDLPANYNSKAQSRKLEMPEPIKGVLVEYFAEELRTCAEVFQGHALEWARSYNV
jgi:hypothetical protein